MGKATILWGTRKCAGRKTFLYNLVPHHQSVYQALRISRNLSCNSVTSGGSQLQKGSGDRALSPSWLANLRKGEVFAVLGSYAAYLGSFTDVSRHPIRPILTSQGVQAQTGCLAKSKTNYQHALRNNEELFLDCLTLEDGTDKLSPNVDKPRTWATQQSRRANTSTPRREPKMSHCWNVSVVRSQPSRTQPVK